jgi:hypothetical protein
MSGNSKQGRPDSKNGEDKANLTLHHPVLPAHTPVQPVTETIYPEQLMPGHRNTARLVQGNKPA